MTLISEAPTPLSRAKVRRATELLGGLIIAVHMRQVQADAALLRRAWQLAGGASSLAPVALDELDRHLMALTDLHEDDLTVAGFLIQDGEVRGRCWLGMHADWEACVDACAELIKDADEAGGPCALVFCRLVCTAMDPDLHEDDDEGWENYNWAQACGAWTAYTLIDWI